MTATDASALLHSLLADAGLPADPAREPLRVWARSGVERLRFGGQASVVLKYADTPFDREHLALRLAERQGIPVPHVRAARTAPGTLAMLLDDLGEPARQATDHDGACAAAQLHAVTGVTEPWLPRVDAAVLTAMPHRIAARLAPLGVPGAAQLAQALAAAAPCRATGADLPPFGLCHSEYHPTSLHIGERGWHLLDFARAFTGPGLLDLASWPGTLEDPDPGRTTSLIESYVTLGGPPQALAARGGLDAASWALGWHRLWVADWFTEQIGLGWAQGAEDTWTTAITRHLTEAATLLRA
jgi:Phosphotransferase enzyme family